MCRRLIVLESFAGVPGFLAAGFRHFYSLRTLQRDHGAIFTFLEEAENERMHLLVCLQMFEANSVTKALVVAAQVSMTPFLALVYAVKPAALHRFVGYLEETAVETYANIIEHVRAQLKSQFQESLPPLVLIFFFISLSPPLSVTVSLCSRSPTTVSAT